MTSNSNAVAADILGKRGMKLTEAGEYAVLGWLDSNLKVRHGEASTPIVTVVSEAGSEITPHEFFDDWLARHPGYFASSKPTAATPASRTMTERMAATIAAQKADRKGEAAEIAQGGNPWTASTRNLTRQMQISNLDPALAVQLKQEAENGND